MENKKTLRVYGHYDFAWNTDFNVIPASRLEDCDLYAIPGGGDIEPSIYGHKNSKSYAGGDTYRRNLQTLKNIEYCVKHGIPCWGNCLGFQILGVAAGMTMTQHIWHPNPHLITTYTGSRFNVMNLHHQCLNPYIPQVGRNPLIEVLAWAEDISDVHIGQDGKEIEYPEGAYKEIEIAFFPEINAMGAQTHFEMRGCAPEAYTFIKKEIQDRLIFK